MSENQENVHFLGLLGLEPATFSPLGATQATW